MNTYLFLASKVFKGLFMRKHKTKTSEQHPGPASSHNDDFTCSSQNEVALHGRTPARVRVRAVGTTGASTSGRASWAALGTVSAVEPLTGAGVAV